ncbi:peptidase [Dokdonia pacifica]|uniref:Peptidase family S41 n=1 Tax=Dokdonia pacifica TaxID=1627892 RepID=A0A239AXN1_9FLAO|nr:S41 family peptidase [Dokdonia pacifica]GGG32243.1 peptidase [Dokdonia pacifica]SNS00092.1 Peptidase family S41 [Dokdonia pacifica]
MKTTILSLVLIILFACSEKLDEQLKSSPLEYTISKDKKGVNTKILGVWKSIGNGYYLEATKDHILVYSYTENFCYKEKNEYLEGLLNSQSQFIKSKDTLSIYLTDYGEKTKELQTKKDFVRIERLPSHCLKIDEIKSLNVNDLHKLYLESLKENYAFSQKRNLNWDSIYNTKKHHTLTKDELFETLGNIAILTKDQHTKVIANDSTSLQYRITPTAELVKEAFYEQSKITNLNNYYNLFFKTNYKNITEDILQGKGNKIANNKIEWGSVHQDIGYIHIHSFAGFFEEPISRKQQIDSLNMYMKHIITSFQEKEAIIIDVSFNFGGYDASALTIASYFTEEPVFAYTSQVFNNGEFYNEDGVIVYPAKSISYTKPVYIVMTDISRSAAEGFVMMMRELPNVTIIGTNTLGTLSGMLGKSIGPYYTTVSNQRLMTHKQEYYEVTGVPPDINKIIFSKETILNSHKIAIQDIIKSTLIIETNK